MPSAGVLSGVMMARYDISTCPTYHCPQIEERSVVFHWCVCLCKRSEYMGALDCCFLAAAAAAAVQKIEGQTPENGIPPWFRATKGYT